MLRTSFSALSRSYAPRSAVWQQQQRGLLLAALYRGVKQGVADMLTIKGKEARKQHLQDTLAQIKEKNAMLPQRAAIEKFLEDPMNAEIPQALTPHLGDLQSFLKERQELLDQQKVFRKEVDEAREFINKTYAHWTEEKKKEALEQYVGELLSSGKYAKVSSATLKPPMLDGWDLVYRERVNAILMDQDIPDAEAEKIIFSKGYQSLEWILPNPLPPHTYVELPIIKRPPESAAH